MDIASDGGENRSFSNIWKNFEQRKPLIAQFILFFIFSNGITVLQLILMPLFKMLFGHTELANMGIQFLSAGTKLDGSPYFVFDYPAGEIASGGGGGLAYFLAVQLTLLIAQVVNFFAQRNVTFKSGSNPWVAAFWYTVAYVLITIGAAAAQGYYKVPVYTLFMDTWNMGARGELLADIATMMINATIAFWVFFPIMKVIFKK